MAVIVAATASLGVRFVERNYLLSVMAEENQKKFELLVSALIDDIISEDLPRLDTTMSQMIAQDPNFHSARIENENRMVLLSWERSSRNQHDHRFSMGAHRHQALRFEKDVVLAGETFGTVVAEWDTTRTDHEVNAHAYVIAVAVVGVCALLGAFASPTSS